MLQPITTRLRPVVFEGRDYLIEALTVLRTEEAAVEVSREHLEALRDYYESIFRAMRDNIHDQHLVIREVASR